MFTTARIKLTAWYLCIIMAISMLFSVVIYHNVNSELRRFEHVSTLPLRPFRIPQPTFDPVLITTARTRLITALTLLNLAILGLAGSAGYFLAGRTLLPIKKMVDEQNRFVSDASHELRTPLTALKATLEVALRDKKLSLQQAKILMKDSIHEVNTLQSLSDSLLTLAQYQTPIGKTVRETVSLDETIREAIRKITPLAKEKSITIQSNLPNTHIKGNYYSLIDLWTILLDNAIKYSRPGGTVNIRIREHKHITVSVRDQGIGISKKDVPFIFERFYRGDTARSKSSQNGYGLGLAIAKKIIDDHRGVIHVTSKLHEGSTFTIVFSV